MKVKYSALALTLGVLGGAATAGQAVAVGAAAAAATTASAAGAPTAGAPDCRQIFLAAPPPGPLNDAQAAVCVERVVASAGGRRRAVARQLAARAGSQPDNPWLQLARGLLSWEDRRPEEFDEAPPERAFRAAAALFARRADTRDELRARANLYQLLRDREWRELGDFEVELAERAAARSRRADLAARAGLLEAMSLLDGGRDLDRAARLLDGARDPALQRSWREVDRNTYLNIRGQVFLELGEREEARRAFDELLAKPDLDPLLRGAGLVQRGRVEVEDLAEDPDGDGAEAARARALDSARAALGFLPEGSLLRVDAFSIIAQLTHGADSLAAFQSCVLAARRAARPKDESYCLSGWARRLAAESAPAARSLSRQATALARHSDVTSRAFAEESELRVRWALDARREVGGEDQTPDLPAVEELRRQQSEPGGRSRSFSTWSSGYYWLSGRLFEAWRDGLGTAAAARGFLVMEHLRGRSLLDALALAPPARAAAGQLARRERIGAELRHLDAVLADRDLPAEARAEIEGERAALERQRDDPGDPAGGQRRDAGGAAPVAARPAGSPATPLGGFATLAQVQDALRPDEALLAFQIAPWRDWTGDFGGGSWLLVAVRGAPVRCYPLGQVRRGQLRLMVDELVRTADAPAGGELAARLYRQLLGAALRELPAGVDRLVVIPDDALHRLPFAGLRDGPGQPPLVARYQLTLAPSATLWRSWRQDREGRRSERFALPALVLANPLPPDAAKRAALERRAIFVPAADLAQAEVEAADVVEILGGRKLVGGEVSESILTRGEALSGANLLYLAAHSIVDPLRPEATGIWLGGAGGGEDGLLRVEQIARMTSLAGKVVVLSSCSGAGGELLHGEGVLSLAYSFFHARARTVVASLGRLEDHAAEGLFRRFATHLGEGRSVAAALRAAQLDRLARGAPMRDWAAVVVLGDGEAVPFPGGVATTAARHGSAWGAGLGACLAIALALLAWGVRAFARQLRS